jgi:dienelactone hydrolase
VLRSLTVTHAGARAGWGWLLVALLACRAPASAPSAASSGPAPASDYAAARVGFHTHLVKRGPSASKWRPYTLPDDAHPVDYESTGLRLRAWRSRAADAGPRRPAVLFVHGGGSFDATDWQMSQPFRDAGFIVMMPVLRGEDGQPGEFSMFYDEVEDVLAAADVLARQPDVDAQRIYLAGHSSGGSLALLAALASHRFRAVASFSGSPDFARLVALPGADAVVPYDPGDAREVRMRSAFEFAAGFTCPARLFWGSEEPGVADDNRGTVRRARVAGLDVEGIEVAGDHHTMVAPAIMQAIEFFRQR